MPYILIGGGAGSGDASKLQQMDNADVIEINLGVGMHYQFTQAIYGSFGYMNNTMIFDNANNKKGDTFDFSDVTTNTLHVAVSYHF